WTIPTSPRFWTAALPRAAGRSSSWSLSRRRKTCYFQEVSLPPTTWNAFPFVFQFRERHNGGASALPIHDVAAYTVVPKLVFFAFLAVDPFDEDAHAVAVVHKAAEDQFHQAAPFLPGHVVPGAVDGVRLRPHVAGVGLECCGDFLG